MIINEYTVSISIGFILIGCYYLITLLSYIIQKLWKWIDDDGTEVHNWFFNWILIYIWRLESNDSLYDYPYKYKNSYKSTDGAWPFMGLSLIILVLPIISVLLFKIYPIVLSIGVIIGLCFLARFSRRLSKKLNIHTEDKNAHKNIKEEKG